MKAFWQAFKAEFYKQRYGLLALVLVISVWIIATAWIPQRYVDLFAYAILGYYWLGGIVVPWVEQKITPKT